MDPKEEAEAENEGSKDEGSEGSQEETILVSRHRRGGNVTVRYVDSESSSSWYQGKWIPRFSSSTSKTFSAEAKVEDLMLGKDEERKSSVFRAYSPGAGKERNLEPYCFDEDPRDLLPKA